MLRIICEEREKKRLHSYCDRYSNGILLCLGRQFPIMRRADCILLSPSRKARMDPMIIPPMPPTAMPSRNLRLRNTVIVDFLFLLGSDDGLLFSLYYIDDPDKSISGSVLFRVSLKHHKHVTMLSAITSEWSQCKFTLSNCLRTFKKRKSSAFI